MMKRILLPLLTLLLAYLLFFPVKIEPTAWQPPENEGFTGQFEQNGVLASTEIRFGESCKECESVHVDSADNVYGSSVTGDVWLYEQGRGAGRVLANTGGRPLGLQKDSSGNLLVVDSHKGLISIAPDGVITTLATTSDDDIALGFADDLEIAEDGVVYFSDASYKFAVEGYKLDLLEHQPNGRLLAYYPETKKTKTLLNDLYFANGIAVSHEQDFVLVNETGKYRVTRYWLKGEKAGTSDVLIDNLPGFPDGISQGEDGIFWVAIISPRDASLDAIMPYPFVRKIITRLPEFLKPKPKNYACVLGINREGEVIHNFQDPSGKFAQISCVTEQNGKLYFGSLGQSGVGVFNLK
ncbi:MAG: SMP-30/gluconolactonase/LRE family protein [Bacteroidota bacterium]